MRLISIALLFLLAGGCSLVYTGDEFHFADASVDSTPGDAAGDATGDASDASCESCR